MTHLGLSKHIFTPHKLAGQVFDIPVLISSVPFNETLPCKNLMREDVLTRARVKKRIFFRTFWNKKVDYTKFKGINKEEGDEVCF